MMVSDIARVSIIMILNSINDATFFHHISKFFIFYFFTISNDALTIIQYWYSIHVI